MGATTLYDVQLRYMVQDRATNGLRGIDQASRQAASSAGSLNGVLGKIATAAGAAFGLMAAKKAFIDFNDSIEQAKITMAGMLQLNQGGDFNSNMEKAVDLVGKLQERAKTSLGTTADMVAMAANLAQPLSMAGASMKDMEEMTAATVVAAKAMGVEAGVAARDIDQALRGQFHAVDPFSSKLLGPRGFAGEEGRAKFNSLSAEKRLEEMRSALGQKAIADMGKAQAKSWQGQLSTLIDTFQIRLGKAARPFFERLKEEIGRLNAWIENNGPKLEMWGRHLGDSLSRAFETVKAVGEFFANNKDTLLLIAKAFVGIKLAGLGVGMGAGIASSAKGGFGGAGNLLGMAAGTLGAIGVDYLDQKRFREGMAGQVGSVLSKAQPMFDAFERARRYQGLKEEGAIDGASYKELATLARGQVNEASKVLYEELSKVGITSAQEFQDQMIRMLSTSSVGYGMESAFGEKAGMSYEAASDVFQRLNRIVQENGDFLFKRKWDGSSPEDSSEKKKGKGTTSVKVNIQRIEVASDDPDRFVMDLTSAFSRMSNTTSPGRALRSLGGG